MPGSGCVSRYVPQPGTPAEAHATQSERVTGMRGACNGAECQEKLAAVPCASQSQARAFRRSLPPVAALPTPMSQRSNSDLGSGRLCR